MIKQTDLAATFLLPGTSMTVNQMGYGAMQLAGPEVDAMDECRHRSTELFG